MCSPLNNKQQKNLFTILFILWVPFAVVALIWSIVDNHGWFRKKSIGIKYCYYMKDNEILNYVLIDEHTKHLKTNYKMIAYFHCPEYSHIKHIESTDYHEFSGIKKIEVLSYTKDSLLAKIRYREYDDNGTLSEYVKYAPTFLLHDTVPDGYLIENEKAMQKKVKGGDWQSY